MPFSLKTAGGRLKEWHPVLLVWSALALLPAGRLTELPVAVMVVSALVLVLRGRLDVRRHPGARLFSVLFLAFWVPMLLAQWDAVDPAQSARVTLSYLRFYAAGLYVIHVLSLPRARSRFFHLTAWLLLAWVAVAMVEVGLHAGTWRRINGVFGEGHPKFGIVLPLLAPILLEYVRRFWHPVLALAVFLAVTLAVLLGGSRGGWIVYAAALAAHLLWLSAELGRRAWLVVGAVVLVVGVSVAVGLSTTRVVAYRLSVFMPALSLDAQEVGRALVNRLTIWRTAVAVHVANPVDGVGPRGFRVVYPDYADPAALARLPGATHTHQILLEVATETGWIGLVGLATLVFLLLRAWHGLGPASRREALPYALGVLGAFLPTNSQLAYYSSFFGQLVWYVVALYVAHALASQPGARNPEPTTGGS